MITVCCSAVVGCSCSRSAADNSSNPQYVRVLQRMEDVVFSVNRRLLAAKQLVKVSIQFCGDQYL